MEQLCLRVPALSDVDAFFTIHSDPALACVAPEIRVTTPEDSRQRLSAMIDQWRDAGYGPWAVADVKAPQTVIGFGGLSPLAPRLARYSCVFTPDTEARDYAAKLCQAALYWAFGPLGLSEVQAPVHTGNTEMRSVLERLNLKQVEPVHSEPYEEPVLTYAITAEDWG